MSENNTELRNAAYEALHGKLTAEPGLSEALSDTFPYEGTVPVHDTVTVGADDIELAQVREVGAVSTALAWSGRSFPAEAVAGLAGMVVSLVDDLRRARVELEAVSA